MPAGGLCFVGEPSHDEQGHFGVCCRACARKAVPLLRTGVQELEGGLGEPSDADRVYHTRHVCCSAAVRLRMRPGAEPPYRVRAFGRDW